MAMVLQPSRVRLTQAIYFGKQPGSGLTSVTDGNGVTVTPNPIITTGTVALGTLTSDHDFGGFNIRSLNSGDWINVLERGLVADNLTDNKAAFDALIASLPANGAKLRFPHGTYVFSSPPAALTGKNEIEFMGDGSNDFNVGAAVQWKFTGAGPGTFLDLAAGSGIRFYNITILYSGAFTGTLMDATGTVHLSCQHMYFTDTAASKSAGLLVNLRSVVDATFKECGFLYATMAVKGKNANADFSNAVVFRDCWFDQIVTMPVRNVGSQWAFDRCVFEPLNTTLACAAIDADNACVGQGLSVTGCWIGDGGLAAGGTWFAPAVTGFECSGNYFGGTSTSTGIQCGNGAISGLNVSGNHFLTFSVGVDCGTNNSGITVSGNHFAADVAIAVGGIAGAGNTNIVVEGNSPSTMKQIVSNRLLVGVFAPNDKELLTIGTDPTTGDTIEFGDSRSWGITQGGTRAPANGFGIRDYFMGQTRLGIDGNGNVGIGASASTLTPTRTLDLTGTQRFRGIAAPAVSEANSATLYFDSGTNKLRASLNGGAYTNVIGSGGVTGSGSAGALTYWTGATDLTDEPNITLGGTYTLDVNGDINLTTDSNVIRIAGQVEFRSVPAAASLYIGPSGGSGNNQVAVGIANAGTGTDNTVIGSLAGAALTNGAFNTGIGSHALSSVTTGTNNVAVGVTAGGTTLTTGSNNVLVGFQADVNSGGLTNAVAIGYQAVVGASDSMVLGNASMKVGIVTSTPKTALDVDGAVCTRHKDIVLVNGINSDIALTDTSWVRFTGPTLAFSIGGFTGGTDGRILRVLNTTANAMTIVNLDAGSAAANQITTLTGGNVVLAARTSAATFIYEDVSDTWILMSTN